MTYFLLRQLRDPRRMQDDTLDTGQLAGKVVIHHLTGGAKIKTA